MTVFTAGEKARFAAFLQLLKGKISMLEGYLDHGTHEWQSKEEATEIVLFPEVDPDICINYIDELRDILDDMSVIGQ